MDFIRQKVSSLDHYSYYLNVMVLIGRYTFVYDTEILNITFTMKETEKQIDSEVDRRRT